MIVMCFVGSLPGKMQSHELMNAIKAKCSPEEALEIIEKLPNPLKEEDSKVHFILYSY